uniref:Uncharacterized protein n=1 Tax=uncultured organism TaxID=155900 RepID=A0A7L9QC18_9ZZZZ|nr:hypothetical protein [uncultured organism]
MKPTSWRVSSQTYRPSNGTMGDCPICGARLTGWSATMEPAPLTGSTIRYVLHRETVTYEPCGCHVDTIPPAE